jgi:hypothetical protein
LSALLSNAPQRQEDASVLKLWSGFNEIDLTVRDIIFAIIMEGQGIIHLSYSQDIIHTIIKNTLPPGDIISIPNLSPGKICYGLAREGIDTRVF